MRPIRLTLIPMLSFMLAMGACDNAAPEEDQVPPGAPVQGGEALQVEVAPQEAPLATDTQAAGLPGATAESREPR